MEGFFLSDLAFDVFFFAIRGIICQGNWVLDYYDRMALRVLFDGWPLVHAPLSSAAWQLRTLLALNPDGAEALLGLPTEQDAANTPGIETVHQHTHDRSAWEQRLLPQLAEKHQANIIHTTSLAASLLGKIRTLVSPAETETVGRGRLGEAVGRGGLARATILWPEDLPSTKFPGEVKTLPPIVHPEFSSHANRPINPYLPDEFLLVQGAFDQNTVLQLLESWTWAAASIGELYPLVFAGLDAKMEEFLSARLPEFHVEDSVRVLRDVQAQDLPGIFRACTAMVHLGKPAAWGNSLRHELACGKAIVAKQDADTESIVGSAAYLVAPDDLRSFGAAMITVVVDEKAREKLEGNAQERAAHWSANKFDEQLLKIYEEKA